MKNNSIFRLIPLITNASMATTVTSDPIDMTGVDGASIQCVFTGTPVGMIRVRASNDGVTYTTVRGAAVNISDAGDIIFNIPAIKTPYLIVQFVRDSGTGTLTVTSYQKQQ